MLKTATILLLITTTKPTNPSDCDSTPLEKLYIECELHKNEFLQINTTTGLEPFHEAFALYINGQNIPQLCAGSVHNFKNLVMLELINDNIGEIEVGTFKNLGQAKLRLDFNRITVIHSGVFSGLDVVSLSLTENLVEFVEVGAFDDMLHLEAILLDFNRLGTWDGAWFRNTPRLSVISFSFNEMKVLLKSSFANINGKHGEFYTNLDLSWNQIKKIDPEAFSGVTYFGKINLFGNKIHEIPPRLFETVQNIYELNLGNNDVTCLFRDELTALQKVSLVKLKFNPITNSCWQFVRKIANDENMHIEL